MARNDVYLYTNATDPADAVITSQTVTTAVDFPTLVLGDTPLFNFYFTDGTASWPSWAGNASYAVKWALSDAIAGDESPMALQTSATPITGGWSVRLPLNAGGLISGLSAKRISQDYPVVQLWSHLRVTDPSGYVVSYAMIRTNVRLRAIPDTQATPDDPLPAGTQFVLADQSGALSSPSNFLSVSGLVTTTGTQTITGQKTFVAPILGAASATSVTASGQFISTGGANSTVFNALSAGAGWQQLISASNTGGVFAIGMEGSAGGERVIGSTPYDSFYSGKPISFSADSGTTKHARLHTAGLDVTGYIKPKLAATTYASLVSAATAGAGAMIYISDCTSTTRLATAAGGGANKVMLFSDGTNWLIL